MQFQSGGITMYIDLISHNPFPELALPFPTSITTHADAMQAVYYFIGKYAQRINRICEEKGFEVRQRLLYMLIKLVFSWRELKLPLPALSTEVPELISWMERTH